MISKSEIIVLLVDNKYFYSLGIDMSGIVADNGPDGSICAATSNHKRGRKTITCLAMVVGGSNVARYPSRRCHSQHMHVRRTTNTLACRSPHIHAADRSLLSRTQAARAA